MHRIDNPSAATALPTPKPLGPEGFFTPGNVNVGQSATIVEFDWLNTIQEELMSIVLRGGLTSDKADNTQLLKALSNLFNSATVQITASQSILVPPWATQIAFRMVGAGGGGAHCQTTGTNYRSGGGGGSGAYAEAQRPVTPGSLLTAVIGVGGPQETAGTATSLAFPGQWTVSADGGQPSLWDAPDNSHGGIGGAAAGGDLNSYGNFGGDGQAQGETTVSATGYGGTGFWGGGVRAGQASSPGQSGPPGLGPGAGGGGVYDNLNSNNYYNGGAGANGLIQYRWLP
jgi:hypothetical protein